MGRPLRIEYPGALYHVTSRGNEKKEIFFEDSDRAKFLSSLEEYHHRYGILIHSYVLMSNHYHLIMETPQGDLLKVMHGLNSGYTGYINRKYNRSGHLFQGRYKAILVEKEAYLLELSRYVHLNPVRAGIVKEVSDYLWSSYPGFVNIQKMISWVEYGWILSRFSSKAYEARRAYRFFVRAGERRMGQEDPFENLFGQVILGGEKFVEKSKQVFEGKKLDPDIVEGKRFHTAPRVDKILEVVSSSFGVPQNSLKQRGSRKNLPRKVAIYLVQKYCGLTNREIAELFGGLHPTAVSQIVSRFDREMEQDRELAEKVGEIMSFVKA